MSRPQLFLVQEDENDTRLKTSLIEAFQRPNGPDEIAPGGLEFQEEEEEEEDKDIDNSVDDKKEDHKYCTDEETSMSSSAESQKPSLGQSEVADEDDGFATPTSSDHKIPVIRECPPAPKKIRANPSTKRKPSPRIRQNLQLDLSREVDLMFPSTVQDDLGRKIKKARKEDSS